MKNNGIQCGLSIFAIHVFAYFIITTSLTELPKSFVLKEILYSAAILLLGTFIMHFNYKKNQFVNRFMLVTVFQMLAVLSFVAALLYLKVKPLRTHGLLFILTYLGGMVVQTGFFLRFSKQISN